MGCLMSSDIIMVQVVTCSHLRTLQVKCRLNDTTSAHLFCGPSPTRYSMTRSTAPLSLGRMGRASGGPGGWRPAET